MSAADSGLLMVWSPTATGEGFRPQALSNMVVQLQKFDPALFGCHDNPEPVAVIAGASRTGMLEDGLAFQFDGHGVSG